MVVDTPPSRNALDFLEAPGMLARFLDHQLFKLLMLPTRSGLKVLNIAAQPILRAIGRVVGSEVLADAVAFFQAFAGMEVGFRERADVGDEPAASRRDPLRAGGRAAARHRRRGGVVRRPARRRGIGVSAAVVNRAHPGSVRDGGRGRRAARRPRTTRRLPHCGRTSTSCARIAEREREAVAPLDDRLDGAPLVEVPLLAGDVHDLDGLIDDRHPPVQAEHVRCRRRGAGNVGGVHILLATDADWIVDEVTAALGGPDTNFTVCREGRVVVDVVAEREPDLAILDLQIGSKGGMAVTMALRLDESAGMLPARPGDHAARPPRRRLPRPPQGADGWLIKPLDPLRIERAVARRRRR